MAKTKEFNKKVFITKFVIIVILGLILGVSCLFSTQLETLLNIGDKEGNFVNSELIQESKLSVHYIDVGQGDSTLICLPDDKIMLIDAGKRSAADDVVSYITSLGITTIDYFILTHSDEDHSGGAKKVFDAFEIKTVYRPFQISVDDSGEATEYEKLGFYLNSAISDELNLISTNVYANFITAAYTEKYTEGGEEKSAEVWVTYDTLTIESTNEEDFILEFFAPLKRTGVEMIDYATTGTYGYVTEYYGNGSAESKNNASPVMLLEYNDASFVFTGDAHNEVEEDFIASLSTEEKARFENVEVFQAGHHGSSTSNTQDMLNLLEPTYVVVSCGENNSYGHPTSEFLTRLESIPHSVSDYLLRTDKLGNIVFGFKSDGTLAYTALQSGDGSVTVYWWQIAAGAFIVLSIVVICVKVTTNKKATAKRAVNTTKKVVKGFKNR